MKTKFTDGAKLLGSNVLLLLGPLSFAQQNLFNVPSSDVTLKSKPFFQQQVNITKGLTQLNSTFCYGLGKNFEVGVNVLSVNIDKEASSFFNTNGDASLNPVYPFFTLNCQKAWILSGTFKLALGTQSGISKGKHFGSFDYVNVVTAIKRTKTKLITGVYYGTNTFLGPGKRNSLFVSNAIGIQTGLEQELFEDDFSFVIENISGRHALSETSFGFTYYLTAHWVLSLGYQITNLQSASNSVVIEFTYVPSAHIHRKIFRHGHHHEEPKTPPD